VFLGTVQLLPQENGMSTKFPPAEPAASASINRRRSDVQNEAPWGGVLARSYGWMGVSDI
jgi:hypothetical protein